MDISSLEPVAHHYTTFKVCQWPVGEDSEAAAATGTVLPDLQYSMSCLIVREAVGIKQSLGRTLNPATIYRGSIMDSRT